MFDEIKKLLNSREIEQARALIEQLERNSFYKRVFLSMLNEALGNYEKALNYAELAEDLISNDSEWISARVVKAYALYRLGDVIDLQSILDEINKKNLEVDKKIDFWIERYYSLRGMLNQISGNIKDAKVYFKQALELSENSKFAEKLPVNYLNLGEIAIDQNQFNTALELLFEAIKISTNLKNIFIEAYAYYNIGKVYRKLGRLNEALKYLLNSKEIFSINSIKQGSILVHQEIGEIYLSKGDYEFAESQFKKSHKLAQLITNSHYTARASYYLGIVQIRKHNIDKGISLVELALKNWQRLDNKINMNSTLFGIIMILVEINKLDKIPQYLSTMEEINSHIEDKSAHIRFRIAQGVFENQNANLKSKVKAQRIFEELIAQEIGETKLKLIVLLNLLELKMFELRSFDYPSLHEGVKELLELMWLEVDRENLEPLKIELLMIQARLALINLDLESLNNNLQLAIELTLKLSTPSISEKIERATKQLDKELNRLQLMAEDRLLQNKQKEYFKMVDYLKEVGKILLDQ